MAVWLPTSPYSPFHIFPPLPPRARMVLITVIVRSSWGDAAENQLAQRARGSVARLPALIRTVCDAVAPLDRPSCTRGVRGASSLQARTRPRTPSSSPTTLQTSATSTRSCTAAARQVVFLFGLGVLGGVGLGARVLGVLGAWCIQGNGRPRISRFVFGAMLCKTLFLGAHMRAWAARPRRCATACTVAAWRS